MQYQNKLIDLSKAVDLVKVEQAKEAVVWSLPWVL